MNEKQLTDKNGNIIRKGSVVCFQGGHQRVQSICVGKQTVNLTGVYAGRIYHKGVSIDDIYEDGDAQWEAFTQSETYMCM